MIWAQKFKMGHVAPIMPPSWLFVSQMLQFVMINLCAKFGVPNFTLYHNTKGIGKCIK